MDFNKVFGQLSGSKRKFCDCPTPKACDTDYQRIELQVCNLPTLIVKPVEQMSIKELKKHALDCKLDIKGVTDREELAAIVRERMDTECSICLETMIGGAWVKQFPCGHMFHLTCAYVSLMENGRTGKRTEAVRCPLCRAAL